MKNLLFLVLSLLTLVGVLAQSKSTKSSTNVSISINGTDTDYTYLARFNSNKTPKIKSLVRKEFGKASSENSTKSIWEGKGYEVIISEGKILIEAEKKKVTKSFLAELERLGEEISEALESPKTPIPPKKP